MKSLRSTVGLILLGVFVLSGVANYVIQRFIILPSFTDLESQEAQKDLQRCVRAITREVEHLDTICWDWSSWDDTYNFVESRSKEYVESNLVLSTFTGTTLNLIYIIDTDGMVVWGKIYDLETEEPMELAGFPKDAFPKTHPLISYETGKRPLSGGKICGVFMTEQGPMLISSRPILTSNDEGPARGSLIMGRFFNDKIVEVLVDQTQVSFEVFPVHDDSLAEPMREISNRITKESSHVIQQGGHDHLLIYTNYPNIKGEPALLIKAKVPREISARGHATMSYVLTSTLISALVVLILILLVLQRTVIRPITALTEHALSIGKTGDLSRRLSLQRQDEIGTLGKEFDRMLEQFMKTHDDLKREIAERNRAEEGLRAREELLNRILLLSPVGIGFAENRVIKWVNEAMLDIFGYEHKAECMGKSARMLYPSDEEFERVGAAMYGRIRDGKSQPIDAKFVRKDGSLFDGCIQIAPQDASHPQGRSVVVINDISERKRLEAQLQQTHKMEAIGTLAGGIAHDFNNVLSVIVGNTELAMDEVPEWHTARENLKEVRKASLRAKDMVRQILAFSRRTEQERKPVRLSPIVKECVKLLRSSIPTTIDIRQHISAQSDTVSADATQISQLLINLCTNAAHAMEEAGGILEVCLEELELDEDAVLQYHDLKPGNYIRLTVSDTGHGIEPEIIDRIFDPYFTTRELTQGTGMGLAMVHGIVKSHGGAITVDSVPGKGATFRVLLPTVEGGVTPKAEAPEAIPGGTERILFVDDEAPLVNLAKKMLERLGYAVVTRMSSLEALEAFRAQPDKFDLVITDMTMPHMTGDRLAEEVIRIRPDISVILCTGHSDRIDELRAKAMGIRAFLMKPFLKRDIATTIREALDKK